MEQNRSLLENRERDLFLYRILNDELWYNGKIKLLIKSPDLKILYRSQLVYNATYTKCIKRKLYSKEHIVEILKKNNIWTEDDDEIFEILPDRIDGFKINLFENIRRPLIQNKIKSQIESERKKYNELLNKKHKLDYLSIDGVANFAKHQYMISKCTYHNKKRWDWSSESVYNVLNYYYQNIISEEIIRDIAKNQPWNTMWSTRKICGGILRRKSTEITSDQARLFFWSQMYENAYQQDDVDPKILLSDDDLFDGWLLIKDRDKKSDNVEKSIKNPKIANSQEIFLSASTPQEAREIAGLNNGRAKQIIQQRFKKIQEEGSVPLHKFKDVQDRKYER